MNVVINTIESDMDKSNYAFRIANLLKIKIKVNS
jgi:hypothetical protein